MPGIMEALFGPDARPGGQPGFVGNTLNNGIANTVLGGVGNVIAPVGNAAVGGLGDFVADITTKNPLEIIKNPQSVLNDRGQVSLTRLLFPDFRRADVKAKADQQKLTDAAILGDAMNTAKGAISAITKAAPGQRAGVAQQLTAAGVPADVLATAKGQAEYEDERQRQAGVALTDAGFPPSLAPFADPDQIVGAFATGQNRQLAQQRLDLMDTRSPEQKQFDKEQGRERATQIRQAEWAAKRAAENAGKPFQSQLDAIEKAVKDAGGDPNIELNPDIGGIKTLFGWGDQQSRIASKEGPRIAKDKTAAEKKAYDEVLGPLMVEINKNYPLTDRRNIAINNDLTAKAKATATAVAKVVTHGGPLARPAAPAEPAAAPQAQAPNQAPLAPVPDQGPTPEQAAAAQADSRRAGISQTLDNAKLKGVPLKDAIGFLRQSGYADEEIGPVLKLRNYDRKELEEALS